MRFTLISDKQVQKELGERIDYKRRENKLSVEELSKKSGISISTVNRMVEGSSSPSLLNFIRVLRVLGELDRLGALLEPIETFRPSKAVTLPKKRIFKSKKTTSITWGDE